MSCDNRDEFQGAQNLVGNLQLLEGVPNEEKSSKDFRVWLEDKYPNPTERKDFMNKHFIPDDCDLNFKNFLEFLKRRDELILERLKQVLGL